ncbi:MAG: CcoQ/FixQ family Cbb3-type cytochrome c oxidase assembly chaperone [Lutibacter sp.]|uniref:CcoQ/FixQ family Cbb3-type cytochrome c oxidase assembly chaperone n=1 Tax=Lutibacter sp. TaxID=1925666 RepID=UPI0019EA070F|nr:CcoQ/FixQ family Cbb3-type cytochrome c oxidase assembly chaperone [Lutibacter sp.]NOR27317.1 CcoQ/FixQ family Cbb3-type cytochrome c oxidase assembly chaperone [Lutibacter sp.]
MLKFIKHNLSGIDGVEIYPIISLLLFFIVFVTMLYFVIKLPKSKIDIVSQLPLDTDNNKEINHE